MSEHSIKELTRQRDNAKSVFNQANLNLAAAEKRLHDAKTSELGLVGRIAVVGERVKAEKRFVIQSVEFMGDKPFWLKGFKIKKDGTTGYQECGDAFDRCQIEPSKAQ